MFSAGMPLSTTADDARLAWVITRPASAGTENPGPEQAGGATRAPHQATQQSAASLPGPCLSCSSPLLFSRIKRNAVCCLKSSVCMYISRFEMSARLYRIMDNLICQTSDNAQ